MTSQTLRVPRGTHGLYVEMVPGQADLRRKPEEMLRSGWNWWTGGL